MDNLKDLYSHSDTVCGFNIQKDGEADSDWTIDTTYNSLWYNTGNHQEKTIKIKASSNFEVNAFKEVKVHICGNEVITPVLQDTIELLLIGG